MPPEGTPVIFAAFFDPNNNGFDLTDLIAPLTFVLASVGAWIAVDRWRDEKRKTARTDLVDTIREVVGSATADLQPKNGGTGWSDVARDTRFIVERQTDIVKDVRAIRERLDNHIDHDHEGN